jgi:DNA repair protein RecO (recombination protein O)
MVRGYSVEAVVINKRNFGEADRIITFLSKYKGKFDAIAKGVRKVASRRGPNLDLLSHVKVSFATGKNLDVVIEVQTLDSFRRVKENLSKIGYGFHVTEIVNEFLAEEQGKKETFDLLLHALRGINAEADLEVIKKILRAFEMKFLNAVGYRPRLRQCAKCGGKIAETGNFISPEVGGVVDNRCASASLLIKPISPEAIKLLRFMLEEKWEKTSKLMVSPGLNSELERQLRFYIEYLLEKELKSAKFIDQIRR